MSPTYAIFRKEFHQHRGLIFVFSGCTLFLHLYIYFIHAYITPVIPNSANNYFIAILFTLGYIGTSAAVVYSAEHEENTFGFLRRLPLSPLTVAKGKIAWILVSFAAVLIGNLLIAFLWTFTLDIPSTNLSFDYGVWGFAFAFVEVFLWGLFWTTRCRWQIVAALATFITPIVVGFLAYSFAEITETSPYFSQYRLLIAVFVACFALWGMLRWFDFDKKRSSILQSLPQHLVLLRYPQRIQSPFYALFHQHIRQASILYPFGIACFILLTSLFIVRSVELLSMGKISLINKQWLDFFIGICCFGIVLFWGTIFGADQKNHSYRFLMRLGIHEGTIWQSRLLIPFLCYIPVLVCSQICLFLEMRHPFYATNYVSWDQYAYFVFPMYICGWFAPAALGAFFSIAFRSQVTSAFLTVGGTYTILLWTMYCAFSGCSFWWAVLPICIVFLIASRLRAKYWLRDINTWRSWCIPLLPVAGTMLLVLLIVFAV